MPGRSWRAGESCGDGEPEGRDRPLEKGVGGIDSGARSVRVWDRVPMKKQVPRAVSPLWGNLVAARCTSANTTCKLTFAKISR